MTDPDLMIKQTERMLGSTKGRENISNTDIEIMKREIENLKQKEDRYNKAYADGVFDLPKLKEYTAPLREKVISLENQISQAKQEQNENKMLIPSPYEVEEFAKEATAKLKKLKFEQKRAIVLSVIDKIIGNQTKLQVYGYIPVNNQENQNVTLCSKHRNSWVTKCWQEYAL